MKLQITSALAFASLLFLAAGASANDDDSGAPAGTALVPNNHGGYNVVQPGAHAVSIPFFGTQGYAAGVIAHSHDKPKFILVPVIEDVGHGSKITVYKRIYFATAEEAEAAKGQYH